MNEGGSSLMERHVKERLVGATILVVLIVLIVPELLSGPKRAAGTAQPSPAAPTETIRSVTVDLATNQTTASIEEPAAAAASSAATPSAAASSAAPAAHARRHVWCAAQRPIMASASAGRGEA
jgi:cell division septation protein DedD